MTPSQDSPRQTSTWQERIARLVIRSAAALVPGLRGRELEQLWLAELAHRSLSGGDRHRDRPSLVRWSLGVLVHVIFSLPGELTMDSILQDLRYAVRSLAGRSGLVLVAVLSLALGIGANSTIWSALDQMLIRPLPIEAPDRVVQLHGVNQERGWNETRFSRPDLEDLRDRAQTVRLAGFGDGVVTVIGAPSPAGASQPVPERIKARYTTAEFLEVAAERPQIGRWLLRDDERSGAAPVAVLSHAYWQRSTGSDPRVLGSTIRIDGREHEIVGVLPQGFWFRNRNAQIWLPLENDLATPRTSRWLQIAGRIAPGHDQDAVAAELAVLAAQLELEHPADNANMGIRVESLRQDLLDPDSRQAGLLAAAATAFVLLIACANVANLLLAAATSRGREVAVRRALGASGLRLTRLYLTEAMLLAMAGGAAGLVLALAGTRWLNRALAGSGALTQPLVVDGRLLIFTMISSLVVGLTFGLAPALHLARRAGGGDLGRSATDSRAGGSKTRRVLVVGEVAMTLVLVICSVLLVQGSRQLAKVDLGLDASDLTTFEVSLPESQYPDGEERSRIFERLRTEFASLPAVETVAAASFLPSTSYAGTYYGPPGSGSADTAVAEYRSVTEDYFASLDVPVLAGRAFDARDGDPDSRHVIINRALAELHWAEEDPVGDALLFSSGPRTVVGVVENTRDGGPDDEIRPMLFLSATQQQPVSLAFLLEGDASAEALVQPIRERLAAVDPTIALDSLQPLDAVIARDIAGSAVLGQIFSTVALMALVLALGGVYGVVSFWVGQRLPEFGVRMALGADRRQATAEVLRHGFGLALLGLGVGLVLSAGLSQLLSGLLYGVDPFDPLIFGSAAACLALAVLGASWLPARRAASIDPAVVLRDG